MFTKIIDRIVVTIWIAEYHFYRFKKDTLYYVPLNLLRLLTSHSNNNKFNNWVYGLKYRWIAYAFGPAGEAW